MIVPMMGRAGGAGSVTGGQIATVPSILAPVKWGFINNDVLRGTNPATGLSFGPLTDYTYDNGAYGVGATVTSNVDGALSIDGNTPALGDRVVVVDPYTDGSGGPPHPDGVYDVTDLGSASTPWVLTRSSDHNTAATLGTYWAVTVTDGTTWAGATVQQVVINTDSGTSTPFVVGTDGGGISVAQYSSLCLGQQASAQGANSSAFGTQSVAVGQNSVALGNTAVAYKDTDTALGGYSFARGNYSTTLGFASYANGAQSVAAGANSNAYIAGMTALAGGQISNPGDTQATMTVFCGTTANNTPTALGLPFSRTFAIQDYNGDDDYGKTMLVRGYLVARRTDTPGTDSAWSFQGVLRGDGSSTYTWVGGSAPSLTLIAQDSAASAWTAAFSVSANVLTVTVTGSSAETIDWNCTLETREVE